MRISAVLLVITSLICILQFTYVYQSSNYFINNIEAIEEKYKSKDYESSLRMCRDTTRKWKNSVGISDIFLYHDYVDEITANMEKMYIYSVYRNDTEFLSVCSLIKNQLESLRNSEIPNLENII